MNRKGKLSGFAKGLIAAAVILVVLAYLGIVNMSSLSTVGDKLPGNSKAPTAAEVSANPALQPAIDASPVSKYNNTLIGATFTAYDNGARMSDTTTPFSFTPGGNYEIIASNGQHYTSRISGSVNFAGQVTKQIDMMPNGTLSGLFFNSAGTASTAQTLAAGDEKYVKVQLTALNDKVFSNPQADMSPVLCFNYNTTAIDKIEVVGASKASIPQQAVGTYEECYTAPFKTLADGQETTVQLLVDADDTNAPAHDATMIVYDVDLYTKTSGDIGARAYGVENDAGSDIGGVNPTVTLDFTS